MMDYLSHYSALAFIILGGAIGLFIAVRSIRRAIHYLMRNAVELSDL